MTDIHRQAEPRIGIVKVINSPLGFYVLSLLIVETFLAAVLIGADKRIGHEAVVAFIYLGVSMFVFVVLVVTVLAWAKPMNITFDRDAHLQNAISGLSHEVKVSKKLDEALRDAQYFRAQQMNLQASHAYRQALAHDPDSEEAKIGLAVSISYVNQEDLSEPLRILDDVILKNGRSPKAYYNRACIRCIGLPNDRTKRYLDDLRKAIQIRPEYRDYAREDQDFDRVRKDPAFQSLISQ